MERLAHHTTRPAVAIPALLGVLVVVIELAKLGV
jgi:hypothetical protein